MPAGNASASFPVGLAPEEIQKKAAGDSVTGRFTTPDEVATLVVMAASDRIGNVTGAAGKGVGDTFNSVTGDRAKFVGDGVSSLGTGIQGGLGSVSQGVENAGQWKLGTEGAEKPVEKKTEI